MIEYIHADGLDEICLAIVELACKDYRAAYKHNDFNEIAKLDRFFFDGTFELLANQKIDPDYIVRELIIQAKDDTYRQKNRANLVMAYARIEINGKKYL